MKTPIESKLAAVFCAGMLFGGGWAVAGECVVNAPPVPPVPNRVVFYLPPPLPDGGIVTTGCSSESYVPNAVRAPGLHLVSRNADCAAAVRIARQGAAIDNGWADGGIP